MQKLTQNGNSYIINRTKPFSAIRSFKRTSIEKAFNFAYDMSFGEEGEHRSHRSGGSIRRKTGEIFINTFQGKLAEFAVYNEFCGEDGVSIPKPDLETYDLGRWDSYDFEVNGKKISVKSTKHYGNLLLLETKDWNLSGQYKPNLASGDSSYDFFILVRISPDSDGLMKRNRFLYKDHLDRDELGEKILAEKWEYDIPGYITHDQLVYAISNKFIIPKGAVLNKRTTMDAENYYVQAGDMAILDHIFENLR